jgi:hypothetical protein
VNQRLIEVTLVSAGALLGEVVELVLIGALAAVPQARL